MTWQRLGVTAAALGLAFLLMASIKRFFLSTHVLQPNRGTLFALEVTAVLLLFTAFVFGELFKILQGKHPGLTFREVLLVMLTLGMSLLIYSAAMNGIVLHQHL